MLKFNFQPCLHLCPQKWDIWRKTSPPWSLVSLHFRTAHFKWALKAAHPSHPRSGLSGQLFPRFPLFRPPVAPTFSSHQPMSSMQSTAGPQHQLSCSGSYVCCLPPCFYWSLKPLLLDSTSPSTVLGFFFNHYPPCNYIIPISMPMYCDFFFLPSWKTKKSLNFKLFPRTSSFLFSFKTKLLWNIVFILLSQKALIYSVSTCMLPAPQELPSLGSAVASTLTFS